MLRKAAMPNSKSITPISAEIANDIQSTWAMPSIDDRAAMITPVIGFIVMSQEYLFKIVGGYITGVMKSNI